MWFTETPWPPMIGCGLLAIVLAVAWATTRRGACLVGAVACLLAGGVVFFVERAIVTEAERVEQKVVGLVTAFQDQDRERTLSHVSTSAEDIRRAITRAMERVEVGDDLQIKQIQAEIVAEGTAAVTRFRANATVIVDGRDVGFRPSRWELRWQREDGDWRVVNVKRIDPVSGDVMELFERR